MSSRSIFCGRGLVQFLIHFNILFDMLAERRIFFLTDLAHGFDFIPSKLGAKRQNKLVKVTFF